MKNLLKKYQFEILTAMILLLNLVLYLPVMSGVTGWTIMPYALSYRLGFISRGLMGTILRLAFPMLTWKQIYVYILFNILLLCALTVFFVHKIVVKAYDESKTGIYFLLGLFLVNPASVSFLFLWGNYGRLDMYLLMTLMIVALMVISDKCVWLAPIMCVAAVLVHQGFVFQYYPAVLVLLFYSGFVMKRKYGKSIFIVALIAGCAMFLYMQFGSHINYTYEETLAIIDTTTDLPRVFLEDEMMIRIEYYMGVLQTVYPLVIEPLARNVIKSLTFLVFLIPMIVIIIKLWSSFAKSHKNILCKLLPWLILVAEIPMFVLTCDYGRDFSAFFLSNFITIFALYAMGDEGMKQGVHSLAESIKANPVYYVFVLLLCASAGKFGSGDIGELGSNFYALIESILY